MGYLRIKENFNNGLWNKSMVERAYRLGYIDKWEYENIINKEPYPY